MQSLNTCRSAAFPRLTDSCSKPVWPVSGRSQGAVLLLCFVRQIDA